MFAMRPYKRFDWNAMQDYIDEGNGYLRCHARFGIAHATWINAIKRGEIRVNSSSPRVLKATNRYDWDVVRAFYESGATALACRRRFGCSKSAWDKATKRGLIALRPRAWTVQQALTNSTCRITIKRTCFGLVYWKIGATGAA
jgi:hypothetical protein